MSCSNKNKDSWTVSQLQAIFDLELGSWLLPKYIPLNPIIIDDRSVEEYKMKLAGTSKIISRCKTALVRLVKCPSKLFDDSEINIRNIIHQVNDWFTGLTSFLEDLLGYIKFDISEDLEKSIQSSKNIVDKWTNKVYPLWVSKWNSSDESVDNNKDIDESVDNNKDIDESVYNNKDIDERVDNGKDIDERVDNGKDIDERVDNGKDIDESVDNGKDKKNKKNKKNKKEKKEKKEKILKKNRNNVTDDDTCDDDD